MVWAALKLVPGWVWLAIGVAIACMGAIYAIDHNGYTRGAAAVQVKWDTERAAMQTQIAKEKERQAQVVVRTVIEYQDRIKVVKEKGDEIVRQIPVLVPSGGCLLGGGFRVLHDAAASGELPADPGSAAAAADPVEASAAIETVAENYAACRADQARLTALQQLVKEITHAGNP